MTARVLEWAEQYTLDLLAYLAAPREDGLMRAYDLGRRALDLDIPIGELVIVHGRAMTRAGSGGSGGPAEVAVVAQRASEFLAEALAPYQMGLRGYQEANALLKRLNETLEQRVEERSSALREANRRKDEFLAMLAHELRNPLAPIINSLHLLRTDDTGARFHHARNIIERQVGQLTRLVDDLLEVSRITTGRVRLEHAILDVRLVVERAVETTRPLIERKKHKLAVSLPPEPVWLYADATRLEQVVVNLLNNAAKYTDDGGGIWLTVVQQADQMVLSLRDTGVGIAAELLPRIFDLFTQADRSLDRSQGGLGIGLSLVQKLVEMHRGTVEAKSPGLGLGSEFVVRFPVQSSTTPPACPSTLEPTVKPTTARRVLVVDDNVDAADSLAELLALAGQTVWTAHTGPAALAAAKDNLPDVVLLDIGLPGLDGFEVARRLRADPTHTGVFLIAMTGYGRDTDLQRSVEAGFDHHLVKPVDPTKVLTLLTALPRLK
jgi:signal transduction histidine kinase